VNANNFALNNNNHYVRTGCATDPVSFEELSLIAFIIFGTETLKKHGLSENTITILYRLAYFAYGIRGKSANSVKISSADINDISGPHGSLQ